MENFSVHFSDFFDVAPSVLEDYGAFDISLVNDLPLFIDPFLLFNSDDANYQRLHEDIIRYMRFLKDRSVEGVVDRGLLRAWFMFPEVKQNWLGFSFAGNQGHGLGWDFANALHRNLRSVFRQFGEETVTEGSHIEKLTLIGAGVGRDNISDFTVNLIKDYLASYTQEFAREHVDSSLRDHFHLPKARFDYETRSWASATYELPALAGDFVLLTPTAMLTKDDSWINRGDLLSRLPNIVSSLPDEALRSEVNQYLIRAIPTDPKPSTKEVREVFARLAEQFPDVLDYYIHEKEESGDRAVHIAGERVAEVQSRFVAQTRELIRALLTTDFYETGRETYEEARARLLFLKDVIENKGGHHLFYLKGEPLQRESDLQVMYLLTWFATPLDVSREVNDGRGPADFKVSRGAVSKTLVEFKLAKNTQLERNLAKQAEIYEKASGATEPSLKAILYFSDREWARVERILKRLKLSNSPHIVLIDARTDNKPSGSKA
jgi:hypothetical protein